MGVTYKLKQEVVDFIVQKKRVDPSLSCRKLVTLLQVAFQVDVSKSSINAVIKEFNLSNPVGRRSDKARKNFFIPSETKQQLLAQVVPFLPQVATPVVPAEDIVQPVEKQEEVIYREEEQIIFVKEELPEVKEEPVHLAPDLITPVPVEIKEKVQEQVDWSDAGGPLLENMGFFFIRAFMQDVLRRPRVGQVFTRAAGMEEQDAQLLEAVVFLKAMGGSSVGDHQGAAYQSLAAMFEADQKKMADLFSQFFGKSIPLNALSVALETELGTAFVQGAFLKCVADTGRSFYLSADLGELLTSSEAGRGCPIFKAIEQAVDRILVDRQPLVFDLRQGLDPVAQAFLVFLDGRAKDRIDKIELWGNNSEELWHKICNRGQKHQFIAKICSNLDRYVCFEKIGEPYFYEDSVLGHAYELEEGLCVIDQQENLKLRAVLAGIRGQDEKFVLLTNILEKELTKIQILEKYLDNNGVLSGLLHNNDKNMAISHNLMGNMFNSRKFMDKNSTLDAILEAALQSFKTYGEQTLGKILGENDVLPKLYSTPARVRYQKNLVHVRFEAEKTWPYFVQLQTAVDCVNRFAIRDYLGRRICFALVPFVDK